jgi:hypothetical protein
MAMPLSKAGLRVTTIRGANMFTILLLILFGPIGLLAGLMNGRAKARHRASIAESRKHMRFTNPAAYKEMVAEERREGQKRLLTHCIVGGLALIVLAAVASQSPHNSTSSHDSTVSYVSADATPTPTPEPWTAVAPMDDATPTPTTTPTRVHHRHRI